MNICIYARKVVPLRRILYRISNIMKAKPYFYVAATIAALIVTYVTGWLFYAFGLFVSYSDGFHSGWVRTSFTLNSLKWLGIVGLYSTVVYLPLYTYLKRLYESDILTARTVMNLPALDFENELKQALFYPLSFLYFVVTCVVIPFIVSHIKRIPDSEWGGWMYSVHAADDMIDPDSPFVGLLLVLFVIQFLFAVVYFIIYFVRRRKARH